MPRAAALARPSDSRSDAELVDAIRLGDQSAFNVLYDRYFQRVYHFAYQRVRNAADAEEAAQETFTAVFRVTPKIQIRSGAFPW